MPKAPTGGVVEKTTARGTSFALRFRAHGRRQFLHLGYAVEGWTRQRAEQELHNVLADVRRGVWRPPPDPADAPTPREMPTFHEFASDWFQAQTLEGGRTGHGLTPAGAADLKWRLCSHLLPMFANQRLDEITIEDVDRYRQAKVREAERRRRAIAAGQPPRDRDGRRLRPLSTTRINKTLSTVAAILEVAVEYELVPRNVAKRRRRRLPAVTRRRCYVERADHVAALLDAAGRLDAAARTGRGQRHALLATLVFAGLRISEALALTCRDVDLARGKIGVRQSKTDAGVRKVRILPVLGDELLALRAGLPDPSPAALIFPTSTGRRQSVSNIRARGAARGDRRGRHGA